ncbi:MAG: hypothetical protein RMN53_15135 [Anaerolineae bacterium]|nr:hypothetical protein [Anaerolineae bacterium]
MGRFLQPDTIVPEPGNPQALNRYMYVLGNPLRYVDFTGHFAYDITVRSFAPFEEFGFGFRGDNRGYSTSWEASSRTALHLQVDMDRPSVACPGTCVENSPSHHAKLGSGQRPGRGNVQANFRLAGSRTEASVEREYYGTNGVIPRFVPEALTSIDVYLPLTLVEDKSALQLHVKGSLTGDNFPATEALLRDQSGQVLFLGIGFYDTRGGDKDTGPFRALPGNGQFAITSFELTITLDNRGRFTGVLAGGKRYSISDWNRWFSSCDPHNPGSCRGGR